MATGVSVAMLRVAPTGFVGRHLGAASRLPAVRAVSSTNVLHPAAAAHVTTSSRSDSGRRFQRSVASGQSEPAQPKPEKKPRPQGQKKSIAAPEVSVASWRLEQLLEAEITSMAMQEPQELTLPNAMGLLTATGTAELAQVLHEELPVSYAQRVKMLESLPDWRGNQSLARIRQMYVNSFKELRLADPGQPASFHSTLNQIKQRHVQTNYLVDGFRKYAEAGSLTDSEISAWLDDFFSLRISTNMLLSRYLHLSSGTSYCSMNTLNEELDFDPGYDPYATSIDPHCDVARVARHAAHVTSEMARTEYGRAPPIVVVESQKVYLPLVPRYLFYILSELLKNSLRATVEAQRGAWTRELPPIEVLVSGNKDACSCRVSDRGNGVPVRDLRKVWSYLYSSAEPVKAPLSRMSVESPSDLRRLRGEASRQPGEEVVLRKRGSLQNSESATPTPALRSPLAGLGCGLPLSRLYARYLGGSVELQTLPNFGTDVFVYLKRQGSIVKNEDTPQAASPASSRLAL